ncbi:MAG TPA: class D sortase [Gemmatimonadaceae bacterium]|nr:class D sortase [Gemmatimonadaceae bacterium]
MRRVAGIGLTLLGLLLLGHVGTTYASGALARDRARAEWAAVEARRSLEGAVARLDARSGSAVAPAIGSPVARLRIPRLGLDEIVVAGVADAQLNAGPGHLPGTPLPGEAGNSIISAHRDRHFRGLDRVAVGDTIDTQSRQHSTRWVVREIRVVGSDTPALFGSPEPVLTLTTCWPVRFLGPAPDRLLITATPLGAEGVK